MEIKRFGKSVESFVKNGDVSHYTPLIWGMSVRLGDPSPSNKEPAKFVLIRRES